VFVGRVVKALQVGWCGRGDVRAAAQYGSRIGFDVTHAFRPFDRIHLRSGPCRSGRHCSQ
jgi:hypothetical protein